MKKYLSLLLLCAAALLSSCEKHDYAEDLVGYYSFEESGTLSIGGQQLPYEDSGKFAVSRKAHNQIIFTGDFMGEGFIGPDGSKFSIYDDTSDFTVEGIRYHFDNTYTNCYFSDKRLSWTTTAAVTAVYNGQTLTGVLKTSTVAKR